MTSAANPESLLNSIDSDSNFFMRLNQDCSEHTIEQFESFCRANIFDDSHLKIMAINVRSYFKNISGFLMRCK